MAAGATTRHGSSGPLVQRMDVDELSQHLATLEQELDGGRRIELTRGSTVIAELKAVEEAPAEVTRTSRPMPDFMGRMHAIFGETPLDGDSTLLIREDRDARD